ncbi:hypothetical protein SCA6_018086 [Theobroma cacao]
MVDSTVINGETEIQMAKNLYGADEELEQGNEKKEAKEKTKKLRLEKDQLHNKEEEMRGEMGWVVGGEGVPRIDGGESD